jgi:uncharacterized protein DUF349
MGLFDRRRNVPEWKHDDPAVRRAAVADLNDPALLAEVARTDGDERVREEAVGVLHGLALEGDLDTAWAALEGLVERRHLVSVARSSVNEAVSREALERLQDPRALGSVARHGRHVGVCLAALRGIADAAELASVARKSDHSEVALAALERIASLDSSSHEGISLEEILLPVAERARDKQAAKKARAMLASGKPEPAAQSSRPGTDRRRQMEICERMEQLAQSEGSSSLAAGMADVREAWIDLLPDVDDDLAERFQQALHAARERLARNQTELEERRKREQAEEEFAARNIVPRRALCERLEQTLPPQAEEMLKEARFEWDRLGPLATEEGESLQRRFDAAASACESRLSAWQSEQASEKLQEEREEARRQKERRAEENRQKLSGLVAEAEKLAHAEKPPLKALTRVMKQIQSVLDDPGPVGSRSEQASLEKRLKTIQTDLMPKFLEAKNREDWERWANTGVQEDLCARAEALRGLDSPLEAARQLAPLQEQWNKASRASGDRAQEIWQRFKTIRDEIRTREEEFRQAQYSKKEALCAQAEALAASSDWIKTATELQALQSEWKTLGPSRPSRDRAIWEQFRKACDTFFTRRKENLKQRRHEMAANREAKLSLCVQAEAQADSSDWQATAAALKKLQVDWKAIGPVSRKDSEILWQRFRAACDRFFERYKRRGDIERAARTAEREALIAELEAILPGGERAPAAPPGGLQHLLSSAVDRWKQAAAPPREKAAELEDRFRDAVDRLVLAYPESVRDSAWDVSENVRKLEELCGRLEKLVAPGSPAEESGVSPAERLAAHWVDAMAANTIGGGVKKDESKSRAAAEEARRAQGLWQRVGYVPAKLRADLAARFEAVCRRILGEAEPEERPAEAARRTGEPARRPARRAETAAAPRSEPEGPPTSAAPEGEEAPAAQGGAPGGSSRFSPGDP